MQLASVTVTVDVEKEPLQEYDTKTEGDKEATCFVASEAGKPFTLYLQIISREECSCLVYIDGRMIGRFFLDSRSSHRVEGARVDLSRVRPFLFQALQLTDDDDALRPSGALLEKLGTIQVDVYRCIKTGISAGAPTTNAQDLMAVHERSKKAGLHVVKLGEAQPCHNDVGINVSYIDPVKGVPYHRFNFEYRPKAILQAQGILPPDQRTPGNRNEDRPGPEEAGGSNSGHKRSRNEEGQGRKVRAKLEEESELDELLAEQTALEARIREARSRNTKREPSPIVLGSSKGEVIDLTQD